MGIPLRRKTRTVEEAARSSTGASEKTPVIEKKKPDYKIWKGVAILIR